jgi:hypothetical protein
MWPSLPLANRIFDVANIFFVGSLVVGVLSTIIIVRMAAVREDIGTKIGLHRQRKLLPSRRKAKRYEKKPH